MTTTPLTSDDIAAAGRALYGDQWQSALAIDLDITGRNMRYWVTGGRSPRDPDEVRGRLIALLEERRAELDKTIRRLKIPS